MRDEPRARVGKNPESRIQNPEGRGPGTRNGLVALACVAVMAAGLVPSEDVRAGGLPDGFFTSSLDAPWQGPTCLAFAPSGGVMFAAEKRGKVRVFIDDAEQPDFFIDLQDEVNDSFERGMLGIAVDPNWAVNHFVYMTFTIDPTFGQPDESGQTPSYGRLVRYTATFNGNSWIAGSRVVLLGDVPSTGFPVCWESHSVDSVQFGPDGMLFISSGEGARYEFADGGGNTPGCTGLGQDIGAFRAQRLDSHVGKVLRINPANGQGLSSNPFWTGSGLDRQSRVWVTGLRNPFRFCVKPGSPGAGTLFIGDVGWQTYEEINVAEGGENFGWPCEEGPDPAPDYPSMTPANSGCDTLETPGNPGPVTGPTIWWHRSNGALSNPEGATGGTVVGGVFYSGTQYPPAYQGAYFYADWLQGWIRVVKVDAANNVVNSWQFVGGQNGPVSLAADPVSGDLYYVTINDSSVYRLSYSGPGPGDVDGNFTVDINDYTEVILNWGACPGGPAVCPADIDGNGEVNIDDFTYVILNWG